MPSGEGSTYQFGPFRLDPSERLLLRDGQVVSLTPKAFDLLVYLVEHQGRLVEKSTLMAALWPDTIVEEANLAFQVSALRKALGDGADGEALIQTVPTKGYRFVVPVTRTTMAVGLWPNRYLPAFASLDTVRHQLSGEEGAELGVAARRLVLTIQEQTGSIWLVDNLNQ